MNKELSLTTTEDEYPNSTYVAIFNQIKSGDSEISGGEIDRRIGEGELTVEEGTELKYLLETAKANTDPLTGLYNRRYFDEIAPKARQDLLVADEKRANPPETLLLVYIDLDGLQDINNDYGHAAGDEALKIISQAIKSHIRRQDVAVRFGGDEFSILMELSHGDDETLGIIIQNLQNAFHDLSVKCQNKAGDDIKVPVGATIGYSALHRSDYDTTLEQWEKHADQDLYKNKEVKKAEAQQNEEPK